MSSNPSPSVATAAFRLSAQQERAWLEREREVQQFAQCVIAVEGPIEATSLSAALKHVVSKYEILRTSLRRQTGVKLPFQVIQEDAAFHFERNAEQRIEELVGRERQLLSSPEKGPNLRAVLVTEGPERHHIILTSPVFFADGITLKNLCREISSAYAGTSAESADNMQYADLVEWQNELLASEETKPGRDYWRDCCSRIDFSSLDSISLPLEKTRATPFAFNYLRISVAGLSDGIDALAARLKTSPDSVLLAVWTALLSRLLGNSEPTIALEFDGRRYEELAAALGPLARSLPVRLELQPQRPFSKLLQDVEAATSDARNWQESFSWSQVSEIESPLLPLAFAYHELGKREVHGGVGFRLERLQVVSERFKLRLVGVRRDSEGGGELELEFGYDASRLERSAVERIAGYYQNLLGAAVANPETPVSRLPLLSEVERRQLLVEWNQTAATYPEVKDRCLHELFEQQAARTPERVAVRCGEKTFTYGELNQRANQLAHYLRGQGVGPDRPVGLCLERSAETMVAVLGILKAGGAYVPLNPDNPAARLQQQLEGAAALITESKLAAQMPEFPGATLVLDGEPELWTIGATTNPLANTQPENLVYVIYTSGSTGVPKGVAVRHRNLVNYASFISKRLDLEKYPEGLQFATVSTLGADLGNTCIYPALLSGGCLHIVGYEMATDPQQFAEYVAKHPIDVLKIVPSHLQALLQSDDARKLLPRKYLIFGGETLTPKHLDKIAALNPGCEILNHYGPTETTVGSLTLKLKDYDWRKAHLASIPIGRPIANTQVYILDANLEPVPVGVVGELYIAGAGVTAGYLGQPEKTAERFLKDPFVGGDESAEPKMYRTGDRARYGEDGNIEFLGRSDHQVKIRGFRIELGEIEAVLARHGSVKQVVVLAREDEQGEKRLLAYVVANREQATKEVTGEDLRAYLKQQLPDYMVPQAVVVLGKLPLNANGKIDRQALPEPEQASQEKTYVAPRTATEQAIAEIWAEVLRREKHTIGVEDNFFDLGGHSLLATQVISRVRERFSVEIPMRIMFDHPRVSGLAEAVQQAGQSADRAEEMTIAPVSREAYRA
jgi:amino acid adenylation domain-containing protein